MTRRRPSARKWRAVRLRAAQVVVTQAAETAASQHGRRHRLSERSLEPAQAAPCVVITTQHNAPQPVGVRPAICFRHRCTIMATYGRVPRDHTRSLTAHSSAVVAVSGYRSMNAARGVACWHVSSRSHLWVTPLSSEADPNHSASRLPALKQNNQQSAQLRCLRGPRPCYEIRR